MRKSVLQTRNHGPNSISQTSQLNPKHCDAEPTILRNKLFERYPHDMACSSFNFALQHFNSIGHIVLIKNELVFTNPRLVPQIAAKFVSPEEVSLKLLKDEGVEVLSKEEVGYLLNIKNKSNDKYVTFMSFIVICVFII